MIREPLPLRQARRLLLKAALMTILVFSGTLHVSAQQSPVYLAANIPLDVNEIYHEFQPEEDYGEITRNVMFQMVRNHFSDIVFDDEFSSTMLDRYVDYLDPSRMYFTVGDIEEFNKYRYELDDMLKAGSVETGFEIYNRYQKRLIARMVYSLKRIETNEEPFDFTIEESILLDRSEAPWATSEEELQDVWRKQLKRAVLTAKLAGDTVEKAREDLSQRYRNQLSQILKRNSLDIFQGYMDMMTTSFDPHTQYYAPRAAENFNISMSLSLEGIGAVLTTEDEYTKVISIVTGGPADLAGELQPNDRIMGVAQGDEDFVDVIGWRVDDVVQLIRGEKGTVVRLKIAPDMAKNELEPKVIEITRDTVQREEEAARSEIVEIERDGETHRIGVIHLPAFYIDFEALQNRDPNYRSSTRDVRKLLEELKADDVDGVVMDLRNNGGGSLSEANSLVGLFINRGATVQVVDAEGNNIVQGDSDPEIVYDGPLAVLVNRLSASASEIFAGAIQDYQRGLVLGSRTFGKGTVQQLIPMGQGQIKLTQAKFYRISGESTQNRGVMPDIVFPDLYDASDEIGESTLPTALPWDTIAANYYRPYGDLQPLLPALVRRHEDRLADDSDFNYIRAQIERARQNSEENTLSLNEETLRAKRAENEAWVLEQENRLRIARGEEPYASYEELEASDEEEGIMTNRPGRDDVVETDKREDPYLLESSRVLVDLMELQSGNVIIASQASSN